MPVWVLLGFVQYGSDAALLARAAIPILSPVEIVTAMFVVPAALACVAILATELLFQDTWIPCSEQDSALYRWLRGLNRARDGSAGRLSG